MKKLLKSILFTGSAISLFALASCDLLGGLKPSINLEYNSDEIENSELSKQEELYELAKANGYQGTYEQWLNSIKGKDGISIVDVRLTSSNGNIDTYTIFYSNGTVSTFEVTNGEDGKDGVSPTITIGTNGNWYINGEDTGVSARVVASSDYRPVFKVENGILMWKYEHESQWYELADFNEIINGSDYIEEEFTDGLVFADVSGIGYAVLDYIGNEKNVVVPSTYKGKKVCGVLNGAFDLNNYSIDTIILPDSITYFGINDIYNSYTKIYTYAPVNSFDILSDNINIYWAGDWQLDSNSMPYHNCNFTDYLVYDYCHVLKCGSSGCKITSGTYELHSSKNMYDDRGICDKCGVEFYSIEKHLEYDYMNIEKSINSLVYGDIIYLPFDLLGGIAEVKYSLIGNYGGQFYLENNILQVNYPSSFDYSNSVKLRVDVLINGVSCSVKEFPLVIQNLETISISDFISFKDSSKSYNLHGYITATNKDGVPGAFVITDSTGSIFSYSGADVKIGDEVLISASYSDYNGCPQIQNVNIINIISENNDVESILPSPSVIQVSEIENNLNSDYYTYTDISQLYQGQYLALEGYANFSSYKNLCSSSEKVLNNEYTVALYANPSIDVMGIEDGYKIRVYGFYRGITASKSSIQFQVVKFEIIPQDTYSLTVGAEVNGTTTLSKTSDLFQNEEVTATFTPNVGYVTLSYTVTSGGNSITYPAYNKTNATLIVPGDATVTANYALASEVTTFNWCAGTSKQYFVTGEGGFTNSSGVAQSYETVMSSIKNADGDAIPSSVFGITPITTFASGKWANLWYSSKDYGINLYSGKDAEAGSYSGFTLTSKHKIHSIKITFYSASYVQRATVSSNGAEIEGVIEDETVYSYLVNGNEFTIINNQTNGNNLYMPAIEIVYEAPAAHAYEYDEDSHWVSCSVCDYTVVDTPHEIVNGKCACGYSSIQTTLVGTTDLKALYSELYGTEYEKYQNDKETIPAATHTLSWLEVEGSVQLRTNESNPKIELLKNETGALSYTATGKVRITAQLASTSLSNTSSFALKVGDSYVACDQDATKQVCTFPEGSTKLIDAVAGTLYALDGVENLYLIHGSGDGIIVTWTVDASAIEGGQKLSLVSPECQAQRGVRVLSLTIEIIE